MRIRDGDITPQQQLKCGINKKREREREREREIKRKREREGKEPQPKERGDRNIFHDWIRQCNF